MIAGLEGVFALDRQRVHEQSVARFGVDRMVREYEAVYQRILETSRAARPR